MQDLEFYIFTLRLASGRCFRNRVRQDIIRMTLKISANTVKRGDGIQFR